MRLLCLAMVGQAACLVPFAAPGSVVETAPMRRGETDSDAPANGYHLKIGAHWASIHPDAKFDVGVGYVYERLPASGGEGAMPVAAKPAMSEWHGGYAEFAYPFLKHSFHRAMVGVRTEVLGGAAASPQPRIGFGALARVSWEIYSPVTGKFESSDSSGWVAGGYAGVGAVGLYAEGGMRHFSSGPPATVASVGLAVRLPSFVGVALVIPD